MRSLRLCKKSKTENNPATSERKNFDVFPPDIVFEVLNRLPAKTVGRFLLVSKSWEKIIRSECFIKSFPLRSLTEPTEPLRLLIASNVKDGKTGKRSFCFFSSSSLSSSSTSISTSFLSRIKYTPKKNPRVDYIYYVHGLMLIGGIIINPCTDDPWSDFRVFTLGANKQESWRRIDCRVPHRPISKGLCIDGAVYYIADTGTGTGKNLMRFDLKSEEFDIFARVSGVLGFGTTLINYHGKVATAIESFRYERTIHLLVFEAGKQDFIKRTFHNLPEPELSMKSINHNTGEIIFGRNRYKEPSLIHYDLKKGSCKMIKIEVDASLDRKWFSEGNYFVGYVESLMLL